MEVEFDIIYYIIDIIYFLHAVSKCVVDSTYLAVLHVFRV